MIRVYPKALASSPQITLRIPAPGVVSGCCQKNSCGLSREEALELSVRENKTLYRVTSHTRMIHTLRRSLRDISRDVVIGTRDPSLARGLVVLDGITYSAWKPNEKLKHFIRSPILVKGQRRGYVQIGCIGCHYGLRGKFLPRTRRLLKNIAISVAKHIQSREITEKYRQNLEAEVAEKTAHLKAANERLKDLNRLKDEFIAVTSHELRSPLTAVRGYLSFLVEKEMISSFAPRVREYLFKAYESLEALNRLVNNILDVSHLESGRLVLQRTKTNIQRLVRDLVHTLEFQSRERGVKILCDGLRRAVHADVDTVRFSQVLRNLLDNAIRFTPRGKRVTVSVGRVGREVCIIIADEGTGIPQKELPHVFEKFFQVQSANERAKGGAGLGLHIAKRLTELHGGSIAVQSKPGCGAVFTLRLPLTPHP